MNPLTDKLELITLPTSGRIVEIITPGALLTRNWRLTFKAYSRYEPLLIQAIDNWPKETSFEIPDNMSPNTFVARFRDARQALILYSYNPVLKTRYEAVHKDLAITLNEDASRVVIRAPRGRGPATIKSNSSTQQAVGMNYPATQPVTTLPLEDELRAIVLMISKGRMSGPIQFKGHLDDNLKFSLEDKYDIAFSWDPDTDITTLI